MTGNTLELLDGLELPGPDPAAVDLDQLQRLIRDKSRKRSHTALELGTSRAVVRHLLQAHPAPR